MTDTIKIGSIVLVVILAISSVWMYTSHQDQMYEVNSAYSDYVAKHQFTDSEYLALLDQVTALTDIVNLNEQRVLMDHYAVNQPAGGYNNWTYTDINYTGYLRITVHSSTTSKAYARVVYTYGETTWELWKTLGIAGSADFPVLPSSSIEVGVGNANLYDPAVHDISIVYHY